MKQVFFFLFIAGTLVACNNSDTADTSKTGETKIASATDTSQKMDYAYKIDHPDQWQTGSKENTKMVLASLKAFENNDMENALKDFADSVTLSFDNLDLTTTRDSVKKIFMEEWKQMKSMKIDMEDFESVKSTDGSHEYVSLWYKQKSQNMIGAWDSVSVMDDLRIINGKIAGIDEKIRHYQKKKK